jgi:hypothetical protein
MEQVLTEADQLSLWRELKELYCHRTNSTEFDLAKFMLVVDNGREHDKSVRS